MLYDDLRGIALFDGLTDEQVAELAADGEELFFEEGERLFDEGRPADHWWLLLDGNIDLLRRIGQEETVLATMRVRGQWAGGFRAWDEHGVYMGSGRTTRAGRVFRITADRLGVHADAWFPFAVHLLKGLIGTARRIESNARQREALVALGTLAAGLAHEINNPASAAVRAVDALRESCDDLLGALQRLAAESITVRAVRCPERATAWVRGGTATDRRCAGRARGRAVDLACGPPDRPGLVDRPCVGSRRRRRRLV